MNGLVKLLVVMVAGLVLLKVITVRPVKNYILGSLVDGAYYMIKRKLKD